MTIGEFIKEIRLQKGLTQEELAEKTDISVRTIQRIEKGEVDPRSYTLKTIASVLEVDYEELHNFGKSDSEENNSQDDTVWLAILHLSGLFILLFPPIIIWALKKDKMPNIRAHAVDVLNFQISMFLYLVLSGFLVLILIGLPLAIFFGIFSTVVILINSIKVLTGQAYHYPMTIKLLKPEKTPL